jgi:pimeloyl-ACP methyl ester carboxylesterase
MVGTNNTDILSKLNVPALITVGAHDKLLPPELSRNVHALIKGSEFLIVAQGAHFMPCQAPDVFAAVVSDFIERRVKI